MKAPDTGDLLEAAWGLVANAGWDAHDGSTDLDKSPGWHEAALRWRQDYFRWLQHETRWSRRWRVVRRRVVLAWFGRWSHEHDRVC